MGSFDNMPPIPVVPFRMRPPTQAPLEDRRGVIERIEGMAGRVHRVQGHFSKKGAGEASIEVRFPVWFIEKPIFTFGGELAENTSPTTRKFPTISVIVLNWILQEYPGDINYYIGAILGPVSTGTSDQEIIVHWQFEGKALRNPTSDSGGTTDGTI